MPAGDGEYEVGRTRIKEAFYRVGDLEIDHAVYSGKLRVVAGDRLTWHIHRDFFERVTIGHAVNKWQ